MRASTWRSRLRRSPLPWLFCVAIGDDLRQTWPGTMRELVATLAVLAELMELHTAPYAAVPYVAAPDAVSYTHLTLPTIYSV